MIKSIYEEAIKVVTYLQEQNLHLQDTSGTIYIPTEDIETLENLLIHSHKQEKLLKELKDIFNIHSLRLDRMREWYNLQTLESRVLDDIEKLIKELEND